jgi:DNA-binding response OmpR family regulator
MLDETKTTKVLLIDDDRATTELLAMVLMRNRFDVDIANSGKEGIFKAREITPDVCIVDMLMQDIDGLAVCRAIRHFSTAPILVLSVINKPDMVANALDAGADEYLVKPVQTNILIAHLNTLARRGRAEREAVDLLVDKENGRGLN